MSGDMLVEELVLDSLSQKEDKIYKIKFLISYMYRMC